MTDRIDTDTDVVLSELLGALRDGVLRHDPKFYGISIDDMRRALEPGRRSVKFVLEDLYLDGRREGAADTYDLLVEDEHQEFLGDAAE
jgi:hypothetical protein